MSDRRPSFSSSDGSNGHTYSRSEGASSSSWAVTSGQGINATIQSLQNEQERVQKKTFTNWMNTYLCQRNPPIKVEDLFEEIKDGVVLLSLLEVLSGERLPMEKGVRLGRPHHLANISTALNFLERKKIKLVNINATSIADGKASIVLGLVWTIILYFQIEETFVSASNEEGGLKKKAVLPKQSLLDWADSVLSTKYGLKIKDFGKSWADGVAFNAMIHNIRPDLVDMDQIRRQQARINLEHAFSTAENLGISRLLDPEDVDVDKPDEKSIMTYLAQFRKAYPNAGEASELPGTNINTAAKEMEAYSSLMNWLNKEAKEIIEANLGPVTNRESEFLDYLGFKTQQDRREPLYLKLGENVLLGRSLKITKPDWEKLDIRWQEVDEQTRQWLLKLDACLPEKLGKLGLWLYEAEKLLRRKEDKLDNPHVMAGHYAELVQEHREFFKDVEQWNQFFSQIKRAGRYEGLLLHGPHFDHLSKRLESVTVHSGIRLNRLDYTQMRYKLQASLMIAETKLTDWTAKYGHEASVTGLLADYVDCVDRQHMCESFDRAYTETKRAAEKYKIGGADNIETAEIKNFLEGISGRWKKVSLELKSVRSTLEETETAWKKYNTSVDVLSAWLKNGQKVMKQNVEAKKEFFKDLSVYEEKHKELNESANFLVDVLEEVIAAEVDKTRSDLSRRFLELGEGLQSFYQNEVIGRARTEYEKGVFQLEEWLDNSAQLLEKRVTCTHADLKDYLLELDKYNAEIQEAENNFKVTTKTAQSLVQESSQEDVTSMLKTLNTQKETIMRLRKEVPEKIKYLKAVLPNVESLETGVLDMQVWLRDGEQLLVSHKLDGVPDETDVRLENHKAFFTETTYQKSILESKNKVLQKISSAKAKLNNVDFLPAETLMSSANERFQNVVASAKEWERSLETLARLWRTLQQKQQILEEWLDTAQNTLDESKEAPESLIHKHKMFFDRMDQHLMSDYEANANDILQQLNVNERKLLSQTLGHLKERWEHVHHHAPIRLLKLEFVLPENKFEQLMEVAEVALKQQRDQIKRNHNVKEALTKHKQMFREGNLIPSCEQWLGEMKILAQQTLKLSKEEQSLDQRYWNHLDRWKKLIMIADDIFLQLKQLPERWKEYSEKLANCDKWMEGVEKLLVSLQQEGLTGDEYRELQPKLQKEMRSINNCGENLQLLEQNLGELSKDAPDADAKRESEHLNSIQNRFHRLKSNMDAVHDKSSILSKVYDYKDNVDKKSNWLDEVHKLTSEHPNIDSLEDARAYLHEHEAVCNKLEAERSNIQAEIEAGKHLQRDRNAPVSIQQSVTELDRKWKQINDSAKAKHEKLKKQVKDWEHYEGEKTTLLSYLKKAENELDKPLETLSQEKAQKDLQTKKELHSSLNKLKVSLNELSKLNEHLVDGASRQRQAPLRGEKADIDNKVENISHHLNVKLTDLETVIVKWSEYYKRLNNFCDWLNEKESKLNEVFENKQDSPETQLQKSEGIASQVFENHITLENLEKDARGLSQNFRSRETTALKSKLTSVRRQWESLCTLAKDRSTALSGNVAHWQKYQTLHDQLLPWVLKAEKYCDTELPKCVSLEEAKDLYDLHQAFLQDCEENLPIFDQLNTEASYLMDQPNMQRDLEAFQKRWGSILTNSEDRSHKVDRVFEVWSGYASELDNFQESLNKIQSRLSVEANLKTSDVQVLEHELALAKALQEEIRNHQPHLSSLNRNFEEVLCHASPEGLKVLKSKQDSIRSDWNDINTAVVDRQKLLAIALQHRKNFFASLQETEKWLKSKQRQLDSGSEIYTDEVDDTQTKLKLLRSECKSQEQALQSLQKEFQELIAVLNKDEAAALTERFDKLMQGYTQMKDMINGRLELCACWSSFSDVQRDVRGKIKTLQISSPDIRETEVANIIHEMEDLHKLLQPWSKRAAALDDFISAAQMIIKDRVTQRTLHFGSELKALLNLLDTVSVSSKQKEAQLGELTQLSKQFYTKKNDLLNNLLDVKDKLSKAKVGTSNLRGLNDLVRQVQDIRDKLYLHNPEYEHLRELGRQIMASDATKTPVIQQQLGQLSSDWEAVQTGLAEKQQLCSSIASLWQQYDDSKQGIMCLVTELDDLIQQEMAFGNQGDVKRSLDQHKNAEFELHANQSHLDHMNSKGVQLLEDLKHIVGFDRSGMESDLDDVNLKWETANAVIEKHKENLEAQLVCWDQVQSGIEEVKNWVGPMVAKLDDSLKQFDDALSVESRLAKFKDEVPYFEAVLTEVNEKLNDLKELNRNQSVSSLTSAQKDILLQFEKADSLAGELESLMSVFCDEQQSLQKAVADETQWMAELKETLSSCDDITGSPEELIERYEACKKLQKELASHQGEISAIRQRISLLQEKYPSSESSSLAKDSVAVNKKFESLTQRADHIQDGLVTQLEQLCAEAQQQQLRWLSGINEKVTWCGDVVGDRYSVEAKLATIKDLQDSLQEGEQKRKEATNRLNTSKNVLPKARLNELKANEKNLEKEWQNLVKSIQQTEQKLETSMKHWQQHDEHFDVLSQWLKDTEAKIRSEAALQPDLASKKEQLKTIKALQNSVQSHNTEFEAMRDTAQQISHGSGDSRILSYAGQLMKRYQIVSSATKEQLERCEQNVADHDQYMIRHKAALEWLAKVTQDLEQCSSLVSDEDSLDNKLTIVKDLLGQKEDGSALMNAAVEAGEKLYPNTSVEGREGIRLEMRSLRDSWEGFSEGLSDSQRQLDSSRMQWMSFDENFEQLNNWLKDVDTNMKEPEMKATLQEKKSLLQKYKIHYQDMLSHQTVIDSINDKGTALPSFQAHSKLKQLNNMYQHLCTAAENWVKKAEDHVSEHQLYMDIYQQCQDWIHTARDKVSVCAELGGDTLAVQNRLERLEECMANFQEGESKIKSAHQQGEKTITHTSSQGQTILRNELHSLSSQWETLVAAGNETHKGLLHAIEALKTYDASCETLSQWLKATESKLKDCELAATIHEKKNQVDTFKSIQKDIHSKQAQFNNLQSLAAKVQSSDTRLTNQSALLTAKHETVKNLVLDLITKWEDYVEEHNSFDDNYNHCMKWMGTLRSRLQVYGKLAGDKEDVEESMSELQELSAEKDEGANRIHHAIESGERLYPNTSSVGRDAIRQDIKNIRDHWEALQVEIFDIQQKLDLNLSQWSSYTENFEAFQKWLLDMEVNLKEDIHLQATLPEKKAQLQNHKVLHQDILSREHIINNLKEKADTLTHSAPSAKVMTFVGELKHRYDSVCEKSKVALDKLECSVSDHQQYQDAAQDFTDWLNSARERLEACADRSGDKLSLQGKKDRLKDIAANIKKGESKLGLSKKLSAATAKATSQLGCEVIQREINHLKREWDDYINLMKHTEASLDNTLDMWKEFEAKSEQFSHWMKDMDKKLKDFQLKNTLQEKHEQVDKFKKQREEILLYQSHIDRFTDDAQNLMHTSLDVKLGTQVTQLTSKYQGLQSLVKELIAKWESYVQDHQLYKSRMEDFNEWILVTDQRLQQIAQPVQGHESLEEKRALIQMLMNEKDHGYQKLSSTRESGEKVHSNTALTGSEKVSGEMRGIKQNWESFMSRLNEAQRHVDFCFHQWSSFNESQAQVVKWLSDMEEALRENVDLKNTLQEKRQQLQTHRDILQDILSHQVLVDSVIEKAQGVRQLTTSPHVSEFITTVSSRYEQLNLSAKSLIQRSEQHVTVHHQYLDSMQAALDWIAHMKDKQTLCAQPTGDRHALENKLGRLNELVSSMTEGRNRMKDFESRAQTTIDTTGLKGRQSIQSELDALRADWESYSTKLNSLKLSLEQALRCWSSYDSNYQQMCKWLKSAEKQIKECPLKSTLEDKQEQLVRYMDLLQEIKDKKRECDNLAAEAQSLQHLTSETRVGEAVSQVTSRYQALLASGRDIVRQLEQHLEEHRSFKAKLADSSQWLEKVLKKLSECSEMGGSRAELEGRLDKVQDIVRNRDPGLTKLNQCVEAGERLYAVTAADGSEIIRQELCRLKRDYESIFDEVSSIHRKLEVAMVQWISFDESCGQVEHWMSQMQSQLEEEIPLRATLEEKKSQLHNCKALQQDVLSYQKVIETISEKANSFAQKSNDLKLAKFISKNGSLYKKLCTIAKEHVTRAESLIEEHQQYSDLFHSCTDWLSTLQDKLSACSEISGDKTVIQNRLDSIQDILTIKMEGEPKMKEVIELSQRVITHTAPQGRGIIARNTDALETNWKAFILSLTKAKSDLEVCMDQWKSFESWHGRCASWLKDLESRLKDNDYKATLQDKQAQLDKFKKLHTEVLNRQSDLDSLSKAAQDLAQVSSDSQAVGQAFHLITKQQAASMSIKELCHRWEQFVSDHQMYIKAFDQCQTWLAKMKEKVSNIIETSGDKSIVENRVGHVQTLLNEKEEGMHKLQFALDKLQTVLPYTSVIGRDDLRRDMQALQQDYDSLTGQLNDAKAHLDGTLAQWMAYDDSVQQLQRWLKDLEDRLTVDSVLQNTLSEKKLQLERVKLLQLNVSNQQSTIDSITEKVQNLKQVGGDGNLSPQLSQVTSRYKNLVKATKDLNEQCEMNLRDHLVYQSTYMEIANWLSSTVDKLDTCSDTRGDRHAIEAHLHKVEDIALTVDAGRKKLKDAQQKGDVVLKETSVQGQNLIQEELRLLAKDFDDFEIDLKDVASMCATLKDKWTKYELFYEKLSHWIKDTENGMKTDSDLQTSLDEKIAQLNSHRAVYDEIVDKQKTFDQLGEQAQSLLQSSTDEKVFTQLSQLGSRYLALVTLSKDLLKRYELTAENHVHYSNTYSRFRAWMQQENEKLYVCADTSGDRHAVQIQLEKLQEFNVIKEEGQIYLQTAITWGEKTMVNTSVQGREVIRTELQQLQLEWDRLITQATDTKMMLESCLLQWSDYSTSTEQILKWLKDMEKRLRDTPPKPDLAEKKAELQRVKGLYQDIVSYEQMVESVLEKAAGLAEKSTTKWTTQDTAHIQTRYSNIKEQAKDLLTQSEENVAHHQDFNDSCHSFSSWLRTCIEKLTTCSDTYGEKSAIEDKIKRAKSLQDNLSEGTQRLSHATKAGECVLPSTSASGQTKIRQELQAINKDFQEFRMQLMQALTELETCLSRWDEFENSYQEFSNWLRETEVLLQAELKYKSTLEEKKQCMEEFQLHKEDVTSHESSLDRVNEKAQALLKINADVKTAHAISQLTIRYSGIIALTKDITTSLTAYYSHHEAYTRHHSLFSGWLREAKQRLQNINDDQGSKETLIDKITKVGEIQGSLDEGHTILHQVQASCENTLPNTDQKGAHVIRSETDTAKTAYESIVTQISQVKRMLESALSHWDDFELLYQQLLGWISDVESRVEASSDYKADLQEKRFNLERYKALQANTTSYKVQFDKLEEIAALVKDSAPKTRTAELKLRYAFLEKNIRETLGSAEEQVGAHEVYRKSFTECLDWLTNTKLSLQQLTDYSGDIRTLQDKLSQLKDLQADLTQGRCMLDHISALGKKLCHTTSSSGQQIVQKEMNGLHEEWKLFSSVVADVECQLEAGIAAWVELSNDQLEFNNCLERLANRLKCCQENKAHLATKKIQLQEAENLYDEILGHKTDLDRVRNKETEIAKRNNDPGVSTNTMELSSRYQTLCSSAKNTVTKLKEFVHEHKLYDEALDSAATCLDIMMKKAENCNDSSGGRHAIEEKINDLKDVAASLDDGLQKVNYVCDQAEQILPHTSTEGKKLIEKQVTELTHCWEMLNSKIDECTVMLNDAQQKWDDYHQCYHSLLKWLTETGGYLKSTPGSCALLSERKTQMDTFKKILADVENHAKLVDELADRIDSFEPLRDNPEVGDSLTEIQESYSSVAQRAKEIVETLQRAYDEHQSFFEAQQNCEKWLLEMSYRLMDQNKHGISTMELVNGQIETHKLILKEIESHSLTVDSVRQLAHELIVSNHNEPRLTTQIQAQLASLEESYLNIKSTANQIKDRLAEIFKNWQDYKQHLNSAHEYLTQVFPRWMSEMEKNVPHTQREAQKQSEVTQAELKKLYTIKQQLLCAARQCEDPHNTDELDKPKENVTSAVSQLAEQVNSELANCVKQAERHLDHLSELMANWDSVDRMRQELRLWLHTKQEELSYLEQQPSKFHSEVAGQDIEQLKKFRDGVRTKASAFEELQKHYKSLTQHSPSSVDPVVRAIQDDWEELLGQIDILIRDRENTMTRTRNLQTHNDSMDKYLEMYAQELDRIDKEDSQDLKTTPQMQRRRCRSTQTNLGTGSDSEDDGPSPWKSPRGPKGRGGSARGSSGMKNAFPHSQLRGSPSALARSLNTSKCNPRPRGRHNDSQDSRSVRKTFGANATLESESEESGYGETYGDTMHALSFDTHLDEHSFMMGSERTHTLLTYIESDDESTASFISGEFPPVDPQNQTHAGTQTPGHVRTQTMELTDFRGTATTQTESTPRAVALQTSMTSLHSISAQTKRSSGSRVDLLRSILLEVKDIKKQQGIDDSSDETMSITSDMTVSKDLLEALYRDLSNLKAAGAQGNASTQTVLEQGTQTSIRLFPEGDPQMQARQGRINHMLDEVRSLRGENNTTSNVRSTILDADGITSGGLKYKTPSVRVNSPSSSSRNLKVVTSQVTAEPAVNGHTHRSALDTSAAYPLVNHAQVNSGRRLVTQEDLNSISQRLDRLSSYQIPRRQSPFPVQHLAQAPVPSPHAQIIVAPLQPASYRTRDYMRSFDDIDMLSDGGRRVRGGVMDRYHLDDALLEATRTARQLKRMSAKMKRNLREEITRSRH